MHEAFEQYLGCPHPQVSVLHLDISKSRSVVIDSVIQLITRSVWTSVLAVHTVDGDDKAEHTLEDAVGKEIQIQVMNARQKLNKGDLPRHREALRLSLHDRLLDDRSEISVFRHLLIRSLLNILQLLLFNTSGFFWPLTQKNI